MLRTYRLEDTRYGLLYTKRPVLTVSLRQVEYSSFSLVIFGVGYILYHLGTLHNWSPTFSANTVPLECFAAGYGLSGSSAWLRKKCSILDLISPELYTRLEHFNLPQNLNQLGLTAGQQREVINHLLYLDSLNTQVNKQNPTTTNTTALSRVDAICQSISKAASAAKHHKDLTAKTTPSSLAAIVRRGLSQTVLTSKIQKPAALSLPTIGSEPPDLATTSLVKYFDELATSYIQLLPE